MKMILKTVLAALFFLPVSLMAQSELVGTWNLTLSGENGESMMLKVKLSDDGTYTVDFGGDGTVEINGKYSLKDSQITLEDTSGEYACPASKGVYKYTVDETNLKLERISDTCEGRGGPTGIMAMTRM